jgi:serine/threonine-protein kinase
MTNLMFVIANEPHDPVSKVRPDLPGLLDDIFDRALHKDPTQRFPRGIAMADALRAAARQAA